jgi:hypothetical protein
LGSHKHSSHFTPALEAAWGELREIIPSLPPATLLVLSKTSTGTGETSRLAITDDSTAPVPGWSNAVN